MRVLAWSCALVVGGWAFSATAVEGMWQPAQLPTIAKDLKQHGLALDPAKLSQLTEHPMGAIVSLGGCTASFVSPQGLVVTNHHCAYGALQYNSTAGKNLIEQGFLAPSLADELPGSPDMRVFVTEEIRDVTGLVNDKLSDGMEPLARQQAIESTKKELVAACETPGYRCDVYTFHGGFSYQLIKQLEIKDVRLVYAPSEAIGKFGGDIDNWMWPRHTGDFSYLRAYVSPDGKSASFDKANVPYRPKQVLKVNPKGLEEGDFVMVTGYPGRTNRYRLAQEVQNAVDWQYPTQIQVYEDYLAIIDEAAKANPEVGVKYANLVAGLNNYLKNFQGQIEGLRRANAVAVKTGQEQALVAWLKSGKAGQAKRLDGSLQALQAQLSDTQATRERDLAMSLLQRASLLSSAVRLNRLALERTKQDAERESGFQSRDEGRIKDALMQLDRRFDPGVDQRFLAYALSRYVKLPQAQRLAALDTWLAGASTPAAIADKVASLYAGTGLGDAKTRLAYFEGKGEVQGDSMMRLAKAMQPDLLRLEQAEKAREGALAVLRPRYMEAVMAFKASQHLPVYPDANSSLRVTYGNVQGVAPRDAVNYEPFTTAEGIAEKATGKVPFNAPEAELKAIGARDFKTYASPRQRTLPVNFLADLDITGGNSGSPALDKNAELVGLAFDGNWESVSGDWLFNPKLNRSIQVDVRYMLWVMDKLDHADRLLEEMGVAKQ